MNNKKIDSNQRSEFYNSVKKVNGTDIEKMKKIIEKII